MLNLDPEEVAKLPHYPVTRRCPYEIPEVYTRLRTEEPVSKVVMSDGQPVWFLSRYEDVRAVLSDPRFGADRLAEGFPNLALGQREGLSKQPKFMISMDGAEHSAVRRRVISDFSVRRVAELRPTIQKLVDDCVDRILDLPQPVDLVAELALPVPTLLLAELVGANHADHAYFIDLVHRMLWRKTSGEERVQISIGLRKYFDDLIAEKEAHPGDDLISRQIALQREETGEIDREGLNSLAQLLLIAGYESSASMIALGVHTFLTRPDWLAAIRTDPARTSVAVEELLRFYSILDVAAGRVALEDVEIGGETIRAGDGVMASVFAANRDPSAFPDPDRLDLERGARHHVAFGYGPHQCLGQNLSRLELQIVFDTLFARVPTLRLAVDEADLPFKYDALAFGLYELPVTW
ncbi:Cytochrome [Streptomyces lincolnensis]|uniref:Cytochrome n=1 Tax=Streptomyces lincolnensis TaxID=1915 RepID=A0A1B1ML49_STRLN|nr:cytochrome P450 [Streptomyces lincolnensis]ANS69122.1 Cytochrome [Streptomyces lincolnensis]AXG58041.1 Cytochrome P450 Moxa From Nonomuraea Recticatena (Cyp105) pdb [Streptomyces lincolnensis]QMV10708.1 cytochrome P450 [Streptomyces lincolnensis]